MEKIENIGKGAAETVFQRASPEAVRAAKKEQQKLQKDFGLHVGLVQRMDDLNVSAARAVAYREGRAGLDARLGTPNRDV